MNRLRGSLTRHLGEGYTLEVVDVLEDSGAAVEEQILATPTLIRKEPLPERKLVGDFSDEEGLLEWLELAERKDPRGV
jgi:circadian clock protein KaiB